MDAGNDLFGCSYRVMKYKYCVWRDKDVFEGDFKVLQETGIRVTDFYNIAGTIDTKILVEDLLGVADTRINWPLGLADLVLRYDLY